jgi:hypothetical protein
MILRLLIFHMHSQFYIDIDPIKRAFYSACNCVFFQAEKMDDLLHLPLRLQETYCLPILLYACHSYSFKKRQLTDLNSCWNTMYRDILKINQWESVRCFIYGLGRLDVHFVLLLQRLKFYKRLSLSASSLLKDPFLAIFIEHNQS